MKFVNIIVIYAIRLDILVQIVLVQALFLAYHLLVFLAEKMGEPLCVLVMVC